MFEKWVERISLLVFLALAFIGTALAVLILRMLKIHDPAAWVQALLSAGAILVAVWVSQHQVDGSRRLAADRDRLELRNSLHAMRSEISVRFSGLENVLRLIQNDRITKNVTIFPPTKIDFPIYSACAASLGRLDDAVLRDKIIIAYATIATCFESVNESSRLAETVGANTFAGSEVDGHLHHLATGIQQQVEKLRISKRKIDEILSRDFP